MFFSSLPQKRGYEKIVTMSHFWSSSLSFYKAYQRLVNVMACHLHSSWARKYYRKTWFVSLRIAAGILAHRASVFVFGEIASDCRCTDVDLSLCTRRWAHAVRVQCREDKGKPMPAPLPNCRRKITSQCDISSLLGRIIQMGYTYVCYSNAFEPEGKLTKFRLRNICVK